MARDDHEPDPVRHFQRVAAEWRDPLRSVADVAVWALDHIEDLPESDRDLVRRAADQLLRVVIGIQQSDHIPSGAYGRCRATPHPLGDGAAV